MFLFRLVLIIILICRKGKISRKMIVQYQSHPAFVVLIVLIHTLETSTILIIMVEIVILMVGPYIFMLVVVSLIKMIIFFGGIFKLLDKWPQKY